MNEKIKKLRKVGIRQSITDREIDICFTKCIFGDDIVTDRYLGTNKNTYLKTTRYICYRTLVIFSLALIVFIILLSNEDFRAELLRLGHNYMYPVMRAVRLLCLPLISRVHLSGYHDDMCLIDNPFYEHPIFGAVCSVCQQTSSFDSFDSLDATTFEQRYLYPMRCVRIKGNTDFSVSFDRLKEQYLQNPQLVNSGINTIFTNGRIVSNHFQLMYNITTEDILNDKTFHLEWVSRRVGPSRFFSNIFPKPKFFSEDREMALEKIVLIDSYNSESFTLPQVQHEQMLYIQASGRRILHVKPLAKCKDVCQAFTITLQSGDLVYMHRPVWNVESEPVESENQQELSLAYVATF